MNDPYSATAPNFGQFNVGVMFPFSPDFLQKPMQFSSDPIARALGLEPNTNDVANPSSTQQTQSVQSTDQQQNVLSNFLNILSDSIKAISLKKPINEEQTDKEKQNKLDDLTKAIKKALGLNLPEQDKQQAARNENLEHIKELQKTAEKKEKEKEQARKTEEDRTKAQREQEELEKKRRRVRRLLIREQKKIKALTDAKKKKPTYKKPAHKKARSLNQNVLQSIAKMIEEQQEKLQSQLRVSTQITDRNTAKAGDPTIQNTTGNTSKGINNPDGTTTVFGSYSVKQQEKPETLAEGPKAAPAGERKVLNRGASKALANNLDKAMRDTLLKEPPTKSGPTLAA